MTLLDFVFKQQNEMIQNCGKQQEFTTILLKLP